MDQGPDAKDSALRNSTYCEEVSISGALSTSSFDHAPATGQHLFLCQYFIKFSVLNFNIYNKNLSRQKIDTVFVLCSKNIYNKAVLCMYICFLFNIYIWYTRISC